MNKVRIDLKNQLRSKLLSPRDCADYIGLSYASLMQRLNGFINLSPELERKINEFIEINSTKTNQPYQGGKITREFKGDLMNREGR